MLRWASADLRLAFGCSPAPAEHEPIIVPEDPTDLSVECRCGRVLITHESATNLLFAGPKSFKDAVARAMKEHLGA